MRAGTRQTFRALRHRDYRYLWLGQTGHSATLWMDQVARAVLILQLTDSALMLSLVIAVRLLPILLFGLVAGAVADRSDRKRILMATQWVALGSHLFLGVMVTAGLIATWQVFLTAFVAGSAMAFNQPVRQSLIPALVPKEDLLNAIALNQAALSFMRIGGGSLAGLLLIPFDVGGVYLITAAFYGLVILTTVMMRVPQRVRPIRKTSITEDLREGFVYIGANPTLLLVTGLALILFIFGFPYQQVFVPLLAKDTLDLGDSGVGFLAGATGAGAFAGSIFIASRSQLTRPGIQLSINMLVFGGALVAISLQETVVGTALLLALAGSMSVTYMAFTNGILLQHSAPEMHGRVVSLLSLDRGLIPLGAILAGVLVSTLDVRPALFLQGMTVLVLSAAALLIAGRRLAAIGPTESSGGHGSARHGAPSPPPDTPPKELVAGR